METTALTPGTAAAPALDQAVTTPAPETPVVVNNTPSGAFKNMTLEDVERAREAYLANPHREENPPEPVQQEVEAPEAPPEPESEVERDEDLDPEPQAPVEKGKEAQFRVRPRDASEAEVFRLHKAGMTLDEAVAYVARKKGGTPSEPAAPAATPVPTPGTPSPASHTVETLEAKQTQLAADYKAAMNDADFEKAAEIQVELSQAPFQIFEAKQAAKAAASEQVAAFEQKVAAAEEKAVQLYPESAVEGSEMWQAMQTIAATLTQEGDPAIHMPDFGYTVARMAARELGIAPATAAIRPPKSVETAPAKQTAPSPVRPRPVSGSGAAPQVAPAVDLSKLTVDDLAAARKAHLAKLGLSDY